MLELKNVKKHYNSELIFQISHLQLENGVFLVGGKNGSGKTTFLKIIGGLLPFEGDILLHDINLKKESVAYRKKISWSEAEPIFPLFLSGYELVSLYKSIRKTSTEEADSLISLFGMNDYINNAIGTYSAGMLKKLSLLLAFIGQADLIVLDEPLIALDESAQQFIANLIKEKNSNFNTSFLISSHQDFNVNTLGVNKKLLIKDKTILIG